jgi:hypothetical protein
VSTIITRKYIFAHKSLIKVLSERVPSFEPCGSPDGMEIRDGDITEVRITENIDVE